MPGCPAHLLPLPGAAFLADQRRSAGAKGGTLLKGRRFGSDEVVRFLRITMLEEQEMVLIIVPQNKKSAVMSAISHECGMKTPARGIVIALPVEEVAGLEELAE